MYTLLKDNSGELFLVKTEDLAEAMEAARTISKMDSMFTWQKLTTLLPNGESNQEVSHVPITFDPQHFGIQWP